MEMRPLTPIRRFPNAFASKDWSIAFDGSHVQRENQKEKCRNDKKDLRIAIRIASSPPTFTAATSHFSFHTTARHYSQYR